MTNTELCNLSVMISKWVLANPTACKVRVRGIHNSLHAAMNAKTEKDRKLNVYAAECSFTILAGL